MVCTTYTCIVFLVGIAVFSCVSGFYEAESVFEYIIVLQGDQGSLLIRANKITWLLRLIKGSFDYLGC